LNTAGGAVSMEATSGGIQLIGPMSTSGGNVALRAESDIVFNGPAALLDAGSGMATVMSTSGYVKTTELSGRGRLPALDIIAANALLMARKGTGDFDTHLRTRIGSLSVPQGGFNLFVDNDGDLVLNRLPSSASVVEVGTSGLLTLGAPIDLTSLV